MVVIVSLPEVIRTPVPTVSIAQSACGFVQTGWELVSPRKLVEAVAGVGMAGLDRHIYGQEAKYSTYDFAQRACNFDGKDGARSVGSDGGVGAVGFAA